MTKIKLGILISGRGSNMHAIIQACYDQNFPAEVSCIITNNNSAPGLKIATQIGIPAFVVHDKPLDETSIHELLVQHAVDLVCLAGFMRILTSDFISKWYNKIVNIHPSLLPAFKGLNPQKQALQSGVKTVGCTVHYVTSEVDNGAIIIQSTVPVLLNDNIHSISKRILDAEHKCYVQAIKLLAQLH
ncbi:phosphoribosylglycinamide formyltransferase [Wolbachia endosymbiont of Howardula sp.]|uniref:phosphoribosylglycinamide formyltransferase n=1 Tax=Wolbachia endosymbiont of Howardula sp. TaxID=2916816 RepID=UPI00217E4BE6|nr:phosphoribosylglycinamide formyltransferase [Wolbachia endosymbiont of Howardula sp.]UWI83345.1 phosphoribosylglycinamide formyltransferase [Wolbachia endosymbiont of Howardula sp.]